MQESRHRYRLVALQVLANLLRRLLELRDIVLAIPLQLLLLPQLPADKLRLIRPLLPSAPYGSRCRFPSVRWW